MKKRLKKLIVSGHLNLALEELLLATEDLVNPNYHHEVVSLIGRWKSLESRKISGELSPSEESIQESRIRSATLLLINKITIDLETSPISEHSNSDRLIESKPEFSLSGDSMVFNEPVITFAHPKNNITKWGKFIPYLAVIAAILTLIFSYNPIFSSGKSIPPKVIPAGIAGMPDTSSVPLYSFKSKIKDGFYYHTVNLGDIKLPSNEWENLDNECKCQVFANDNGDPNLTDVKLFYQNQTGMHFYVAFESKHDFQKMVKNPIYEYLGIAFYVYKSPVQGTIPFYRIRVLEDANRIYTTDSKEFEDYPRERRLEATWYVLPE